MPALRFRDYLKAAFHLKVPVRMLGHLPANKILLAGFGILGFAHPGFWLLGLGLEAGYLTLIGGNERFQRLIDAELRMGRKTPRSLNPESVLKSLSSEAKKRFSALAEKCDQILASGEAAAGDEVLSDLKSSRLDELMTVFLRLLASRERIIKIMSRTSESSLAKEIADLENRIKGEPADSGMARSLSATLAIQQRRLENLKRALESKKVAEAELDRIEKQVELLGEESAVTSNPEAISMRLDGVTQSLQDTSRWMSENSEFFSSLDTGGIKKIKEALKE